MRHLVLVLGDQLHRDAAVFDGFDPDQDAVWMAEVQEEATHVWCHRQRLVLFFSAMRHFREELRRAGLTIHYHELTPDPAHDRGESFAAILAQDVPRWQPRRLIAVCPGDYRVLTQLQAGAQALGVPLELRPDRHFYCSRTQFADFARGRKRLLLENFYRHLRRREDILLDAFGRPVGGLWNYDHDNRRSFGPSGPGFVPAPPQFAPDRLTLEVIAMVQQRFASHPGSLERFHLPVTAADARSLLEDFITHRLAGFGPYEDAMWTDEPVLYHSRLSALLNLKLLSPRDCVAAALDAWQSGAAPLASVEAFIRQTMGWREYIRGVYWLHMPAYQELNYLGHDLPLPGFYWTGEVDLECLRQTLAHVLAYGYTHHIHRLMVAGLFALLFGVHPYQFHSWHMALYLDAVDWVSLPNTLGMSQFADGGLVGTKPYCATGRYIDRMSNFCRRCRYDPHQDLGPDACPFTTLYWDFLDRHQSRLQGNMRLALQLRHLENKKRQLPNIRRQAAQLRERYPGR